MKKQIEELAKWLHETFERCPTSPVSTPVWRKLTIGKDWYRHTAKCLLTDPPAVLVKELAAMVMKPKGGE